MRRESHTRCEATHSKRFPLRLSPEERKRFIQKIRKLAQQEEAPGSGAADRVQVESVSSGPVHLVCSYTSNRSASQRSNHVSASILRGMVWAWLHFSASGRAAGSAQCMALPLALRGNVGFWQIRLKNAVNDERAESLLQALRTTSAAQSHYKCDTK
jgi:hypothetical protein